MRIVSATAAHIRTERLAGNVVVLDGNTGNRIGTCNLIRGFAYYYGVKGSAHAGMVAVVSGGLPGLEKALAAGLRNGRDDSL
jgi:hypothetical protein